MTYTHLLSIALAVTFACAVGALVGYGIIEIILAQINALHSLDISK